MEDKNYKTALGLIIKSISDATGANGARAFHQHVLTLGPTPQLLLDHGMPDLPVGINGRVIDKCFFDHGITKPMLERAYGHLCSPKAIYTASNGEPGCVVVSFEIKAGNPIIICLRSNHQMGGRRDFYNAITSVYDKGGDAELRWTQKGLLRWRNTP